MPKVFLGIVPSEPASEQITELRRRYPGRLAGHVEPHITVVPPFDERSPAALLQALQTLLAPIHPFILHLGSPAFFGDRVLYLSVSEESNTMEEPAMAEGSDEQALLRLRGLLLRAVNEYRADTHQPSVDHLQSYQPHLTLAMKSFGTSLSSMAKLYADASVMAPGLNTLRVSFVRAFVRGESRWETLSDLQLRGGGSDES